MKNYLKCLFLIIILICGSCYLDAKFKKFTYQASSLALVSTGKIKGVLIVSGYACSECFENKKVCGRFKAIFGGITAGIIPFSLDNIKSNKNFIFRNPKY